MFIDEAQIHVKAGDGGAGCGGTLRLGPDESKYSVAVWREPMAEMGQFSIFVSGLSGEKVHLKKNEQGDLVEVTAAKDVTDPSTVVLRKTLQLNYLIRGDEVYPGEDEVNENPEAWVMR